MKVLFVIDSLEVGGSERSLLEILARRQHSEAVVCPVYPGETLRPGFEAAGVPVLPLGVDAKYGYPTAVARLTRRVRELGPDLICTVLTRSAIVGRAAGRRTGVPVLSTLVTAAYAAERLQRMSWLRRSKLRATWLLDRLTAPWSHHFVANSQAIKGTACRTLALSPDRVTVIPRGRDPRPFLAAVRQPARERRTVLNVGRLREAKGHDVLLAAMHRVAAAMSGVELRIAGEGPLRPALQWRVDELNLAGRVHLLGTRDDVPQLLADADVFAFPSYREGHPGALVEAMLAALPIVASDIPPHRETLRHRNTGILVPTGDPAALAAAILDLLTNPDAARAMGERARADALERYSIDRIAAAHEELWAKLCEGTR